MTFPLWRNMNNLDSVLILGSCYCILPSLNEIHNFENPRKPPEGRVPIHVLLTSNQVQDLLHIPWEHAVGGLPHHPTTQQEVGSRLEFLRDENLGVSVNNSIISVNNSCSVCIDKNRNGHIGSTRLFEGFLQEPEHFLLDVVLSVCWCVCGYVCVCVLPL